MFKTDVKWTLNKLDEFDLNEFIRSIHFDELKVPTMPFQLPTSKNYYGVEEMCEATLDFFKATVLSKSMEDLIANDDTPMADKANGSDFMKKYIFAVALTLKKGLHINFIHNVNRPFDEMMMGLEGWIPMYMTGQISEFPVAEPELPVVDTAKMDALFSGIKLASSYKKAGEGNPLFTQRFGADPGVMEYDGRVYVYTTNDVVEYATDGSVAENTSGKINKINCISSDDMVNWTDHGAIPVAGKDGIAKFAGNSWAPCAAHKKINGKEKFFLYFCNGGNGVCVLTSDSPTGPWSDPLGAPLVTRCVPNCGNIAWLFDPAVFVDNDGTGYLCFGGGPDGKSDTTRVVKLSDDMIHLDGTPVTINAPYVFEDSGINRIGDKYYYTYCSNWNTGGNPYGLSTAAIEYMVADNPLGPYKYAGELFKNQGNFFPGMTGNNHHSIVEFKGQLYLFYHSRPVEKAMGITGNYRSPQVDKITMNGEKFNPVTGTMKGIPQLKELDPYSTVQAETMSDQAGINVSGVGNTVVSEIQSGDWIKVSGVDFSKGTNTLTVKVSSNSGGVIKVCTGSNTGKAIGYVEIPEFTTAKEITVPVNDISGTEDLFFVFSGNLEFDYWYFS